MSFSRQISSDSVPLVRAMGWSFVALGVAAPALWLLLFGAAVVAGGVVLPEVRRSPGSFHRREPSLLLAC